MGRDLAIRDPGIAIRSIDTLGTGLLVVILNVVIPYAVVLKATRPFSTPPFIKRLRGWDLRYGST